VILTLLTASSVFLGYLISTQVPEELPLGKNWFLAFTAVFLVPLFFLLAWWQAALVAGALLLGWFPALIGFGAVMGREELPLAYILMVLGLLVGTRWRVDKRPFTHLLAAMAVLTALALVFS
jgi:hypothetical protein